MATKVRESVQYAVALIKSQQTGKKIVSANVVERGEKSIDQIARELAKSTTLTQTDVKGVIEGFIEFTMEHVASGYRVELGNLGKIYPTIAVKSEKAKYESFSASNIQGLRARFQPSNVLMSMLSQATFEKTLSRKSMAKSMADNDAAQAAAFAADHEGEGGGEGGGETNP